MGEEENGGEAANADSVVELQFTADPSEKKKLKRYLKSCDNNPSCDPNELKPANERSCELAPKSARCQEWKERNGGEEEDGEATDADVVELQFTADPSKKKKLKRY